jgi:predicted HAD superfamily phosphohydrolase
MNEYDLSDIRNLEENGEINLEEEYSRILQLLRAIDRKILQTEDREDILSLIEQREPLNHQLDEVYKQLTEQDKQERETIIKTVQKIGGVTMQGKDIKIHKNGVKISVSKAYIDDKILDPQIKYTVILLPED